MATFVLVHGLGGGGWYWRPTRAELLKRGHLVFTPTLTGVGERSHLLTRDVDLNTHIDDISQVLEFEDLSDVILVGHSYGGMVVTGAADRQRERTRTLVYLDAFLPTNGQSIMDLQPPDRIGHYRQVAAEKGDGWRIPPPPATFWKLIDPDQITWFDAHSVDHPLASLEQKIELINDDQPPVRRAYIWASGFTPSPFEKFAAIARDDPAWMYREIDAGHMMMVSHPVELSDLLEEMIDLE